MIQPSACEHSSEVKCTFFLRTKQDNVLDDSNISVYHLQPATGQQLAIADRPAVPPAILEHISSGLLSDPSEQNMNRIGSSTKFHASTLVESRKSSGNRIQKGTLTTSATNSGIAARPVSTPASNVEYKKTVHLTIQNGLTKDQTDEFLRFRQLHCLVWGNIVTVFRMLEKLMYDYAIPVAFINGER